MYTIDIAYAWHAHLLSPYNYYEDVGCKRTYGYNYSWEDRVADQFKLQWNKCFPLKALVIFSIIIFSKYIFKVYTLFTVYYCIAFAKNKLWKPLDDS